MVKTFILEYNELVSTHKYEFMCTNCNDQGEVSKRYLGLYRFKFHELVYFLDDRNKVSNDVVDKWTFYTKKKNDLQDKLFSYKNVRVAVAKC